MYPAVIGKPGLHLRLLMPLILGSALLLLASCGGQDSVKEEVGAPSAGKLTETLRLRDSTQYQAIAAGSLWLPNSNYGTVTRLDLDKSKVTAVIEVSSDPQSAPYDADPQSVAASGDQIWVSHRARKAVSRIDPKTNRVVERIPVGIAAFGIAIDGDTLWLTDVERNVVARVDTKENRVLKKIDLPAPVGIVVGAESVWVAEMGPMVDKPSKLARINPQTNEVAEEMPLESSHPQSITFGAGSVWIANGEGSCTVSRVDPETNKEVARIDTGLSVFDVAIGGGSVWAVGDVIDSPGCKESYKESALVRIDPATNKVVGRTNIRNAGAVAATDDVVWVSSGFDRGGGLLRGKFSGAVTRVKPTPR